MAATLCSSQAVFDQPDDGGCREGKGPHRADEDWVDQADSFTLPYNSSHG
jgi:hypothetical protein